MYSAPKFCACSFMFSTSSGPLMPSGKPGKFSTKCGQRELPAGFVARHHERLQIGAGGVNGGRVAGAAGTDDHYVSHGQIFRLARGLEGTRSSGAGRVFVPLQAGGIDAGDVGAAVFVEVHDGARGGAHAAFIEIAARPVFGGGVVAVEIDAARLAAEAGDDFVRAVAVEVGGLDGVAVTRVVSMTSRSHCAPFWV